jgi:hypothetical protein
MKTQPLLSWFRLSVSACLVLALASCSSSESTRKAVAASQARHPLLNLHAKKVSQSLLISDAELQGGSRKTGRQEHVSPWRVFTGTVLLAGSVPLMVAAARAGVAWTPGMPDVFVETPAAEYTPPQKDGVQVRLSGTEIRYRKASGGGIILARASGFARIDVTDRFGSYYCRADEIHYRAATNEIILRGRASVSAVYAPGVRDYGLARVDLSRNTLQYSSGEQPRNSSAPQAGEFVALQSGSLSP